MTDLKRKGKVGSASWSSPAAATFWLYLIYVGVGYIIGRAFLFLFLYVKEELSNFILWLPMQKLTYNWIHYVASMDNIAVYESGYYCVCIQYILPFLFLLWCSLSLSLEYHGLCHNSEPMSCLCSTFLSLGVKLHVAVVCSQYLLSIYFTI